MQTLTNTPSSHPSADDSTDKLHTESAYNSEPAFQAGWLENSLVLGMGGMARAGWHRGVGRACIRMRCG